MQGAGFIFKAWAWVIVILVVTFLVSFLYSPQKLLISHVYTVITTGYNWSHWRKESKMQQPFTYFLPRGDLTLDLSTFLFLWLQDNIPFESQSWLLHSFLLSFYWLLVACSKGSIVTYCLFLSVLGKIRTAVGSAQLLMAQKFYQFRELCEENLVCNFSARY